ncbi:unnamed protein product, partial [Timema podura]|nr:unnamed protein product [Timema podura]
SLRGWTARAGSYVAEKMSLFEDSRAAAFLDSCPIFNNIAGSYAARFRTTADYIFGSSSSLARRYLRPTAESPPEQNTTSCGTGELDECDTSVGTSGEEVWGTPTSGGDLDEELSFPSVDTPKDFSADSASLTGVGDDDTELMMDDLLAAPPLSCGGVRVFPQRRRLEPLPEEEDTDSPGSPPCSPTTLQDQDTPSPEQVSWRSVLGAPVMLRRICKEVSAGRTGKEVSAGRTGKEVSAGRTGKEGNGSGGVADSYPAATKSINHRHTSLFNKLRMRRPREEVRRAKTNRL